jgi:hypothetical protein
MGSAMSTGIKMPPGMEAEKGKKSDVKYIRCAACEHLAKNAYRMAKELREELKPGKKVCPTAPQALCKVFDVFLEYQPMTVFNTMSQTKQHDYKALA